MAEDGVSILQTPSYILALLLLAFAILFTVLERVQSWHVSSLKRRNKLGLLAASEAMTTELMLFGVAALLLSVFEDPITSICIPANQGDHWYILSRLDGCPCCIKDTRYVTECWAEDRTCGPELCNCDYAEPTCLTEESGDSAQCNGVEELSQAECGGRPGYKQAVSALTIRQVHMFIFFTGLTHIVCSVLMIKISTWRLTIWKKWMSGYSAHIKAVHEELERHAHLTGHAKQKLATAEEAESASNSKTAQAANHSQPSQPSSSALPAMERAAGTGEDNGKDSVQKVSPLLSSSQSTLLSANLLNSSASQDLNEELAQAEVEKENREANKEANAGEHKWPQVAVNIPLPHEVIVDHGHEWRGRANTLDRRRERGWEWARCFYRQFYLHPVTRNQMSIMRASFVLTHRPGKNFKFTEYFLASMDEDFAKVVGLGPPAWVIVSVFLLLSGVMGWAASWFVLLTTLLSLSLNTKLVYIARHVTRGGRIHRLERSIFWFGSSGPWVMLSVIKAQLFLCSFIFTGQVYFSTAFGPHSCFFSNPGLNTRSLPIPWWVILIWNCALYFALCFVTLPLYSLGVHMAGDFKKHILPKNVQNRVLSIARNAKVKTQERQLEELRHKKKKTGIAAQAWRYKLPRVRQTV